MVIKLHLFSGFENPSLGTTPDMELGHLYDDQNDQRALIKAASQLGLASGYMQGAGTGFIHFDLWGNPLIKAKKLYKIVTDQELAGDMERLKNRCDLCAHWKVLNTHHIENGQPVKGCDSGEVPETCGDYERFKQPG